MARIRLADYVMHRLADSGISLVYTVTGRGSLYLTDALAKESRLDPICVHHEQAAGYAAVGEASLSGNIAVCMTSTGCGATNAISAVLSAWQDEIPVLFISGQNTLRETTRNAKTSLRTYGEQETDIVQLVEPITKYAAMLESPADIVGMLDNAFHSLNTRRRGPVWIDIPLDLQSSQIEVPEHDLTPPQISIDESSECLEPVGKFLRAASRPVIILGSGVRHDGAEREIRHLAERLSLPVTYDASAVDIVPTSSHVHIGSVGAMGCSRAGNMAVQNADLVIAIGTHLRSSVIGDDASTFAREADVIHIDIDRTQTRSQNPELACHVSCDIRTFAQEALRAFDLPPFDSWLQTCKSWKTDLSHSDPAASQSTSTGMDLYEVVELLGAANFADDAVFVTDSGLVELILPTNIELRGNQRVVHPVSQGAMGFALPAAIGVSVSSARQTVVVVGDGSIMMNLQELQTIAHHGLPILILVINNDAYAVIRKRQRELFRTRTIGTDPSNGVSCPEFKSVASAFGFDYFQASNGRQLQIVLSESAHITKPTLLEIFCRSDQDYIRMGRAINKNGKSVSRPLEDQQPYLDRDFLKSMMLIPPHNLD